MHEVWALGLMSGTSLDGVDAALIRTDGVAVAERGAWLTLPYDEAFRSRLKASLRAAGEAIQLSADASGLLRSARNDALERELTLRHAEAVEALLAKAGVRREDVRVIGFHGQTILHAPERGITRQIGDGALLARETGIDVVYDFRSADVAAGGQGAPLVSLYHAALAADAPKPVAILNIGGVGNVTWLRNRESGIGNRENEASRFSTLDSSILAFDTGSGCALIDDAVHAATGAAHDSDGALAFAGKADEELLAEWLAHPFFARRPPKSLDRNAFDVSAAARLPVADRIATLTAFTARAVAAGVRHMPEAPLAWYVCGGGRHNPALMKMLSELLPNVQPVERLGWEGDALEAQAFAYLAVRSLRGLPLSLPETTGVSRGATGGVFCPAWRGASG